MPATLSPSAFTTPMSSDVSAARAAAADDVGRFLSLCQTWTDSSRGVISRCYLVLAADGFEVYPVARNGVLDPAASERLAVLLIAAADAGLPVDGFVVPDEPSSRLAAHFDPRRAILVSPSEGEENAV